MAGQPTDTLDRVTDSTTARPVVPTLAAPGHSIGGTSITISSASNWTTTTKVHFAIYTTTTVGSLTVKDTTSQTDWSGTLSGTTINNMVLTGGTDRDYAAGAIVEITMTAAWAKDLYDNIIAHANQDGTLKTSAVQAALNLGASSLNGWNALGFAPSTVTANGGGIYTLVFNGQDLTGTLSSGMRLRTTRTVDAPIQSTSLNGTTQYYSKSSPAGMTYTDDFTVSAWVKISAYAQGTIASRYNGTSGWYMEMDSTGRVALYGLNAGSANFRGVISRQVLPLNRWVHIAAQEDMSTHTATTTTSYIMFDGLDIPAAVSQGGTNPTALIQAGNLEIGSKNGGGQPFGGKIAQVAIYSGKVAQADIRATISQGLAGTETSLISAYSFNNSFNDLNTTNANNLTSNGSAVATNADSPFGGQANGSISSTLDYAETLATTFATNTTVVVRVPYTSTIPTTGGVSSVAYSTQASPYGSPKMSQQLASPRLQNNFTTTSTTFVDFAGLTASVTVANPGQDLEFIISGSAINSSSSGIWNIALLEDGNVIQQWYRNQDTATANNVPLDLHFSKYVSSGSHTYKVQASTSAGTLTVAGGVPSSTSLTAGPIIFGVKQI